MKTCRNCFQIKPLDGFYNGSAQCKECVIARVAKYRAANLDKVQAYDRERGRLQHRKDDKKMRAPKYADKRKECAGKYAAKHPDRGGAHIIVGNAIRDGKLVVQPCERCGYGIGVQAHHEDYSKPLDVTWLCTPCHGERHREINAERRTRAA